MKISLKGVISVFTALILAFSAAACAKKPSAGSSASGGVSSSAFSDSLSRQSDGFDYSAETSEPAVKPQPDDERGDEFAKLLAVYNLAELDGSYSGTDVGRGFPSVKTRADGAFTTYPLGYGEGTMGGRGADAADTYSVSTGNEIIAALDEIKAKQLKDPKLKAVIAVDGTITEDNTLSEGGVNYQIIVNGVNNLSFIGAENRGVFDGVGLNFKSCDNVIVQNLTITHPSKTLKNEKDCLEFNTCNYVWVDHCELYNDRPVNSSEKDYYDGLCDVKNDSSHVTISYNYLHDAWKTSLVGSGPDDAVPTRTLTYHHNIFENCNSRVPLIRGGLAHVYNNFYKNIGTGINCRFGAEVYVQNNVFDGVKNPTCSIEETEGYWHSEGNAYVGSTGSGVNNAGSKTDFTPSYEYVLDSTDGLEEYLRANAGVGKIDFQTAIGAPEAYERYEVGVNRKISREISELGEVTLGGESLQKLVYIAEEVLFEEDFVKEEVENFSALESAVDVYFALYAADLDEKLLRVQPSGEFAENATLFYATIKEIGAAPVFVTELMKEMPLAAELKSHFDGKFVSAMNEEIALLQGADSGKLAIIEKLLDLYFSAEDALKAGVDFEALQAAYVSADNHLKAEAFERLVEALPAADGVSLSHARAIGEAESAYKALTAGQFALVSEASKSKYSAVKAAFDNLISGALELDLSAVPIGRTSAVTEAGGFKLGVSVDVRASGAVFGGVSFDKEVYLSGYGNKGSKCLQFTVYSESTVKLTLASESGVCRVKLTDENGAEIAAKLTEDGIFETTFENLEAGEYRIFTDIPSGDVSGSKIIIYAAAIIPAK